MAEDNEWVKMRDKTMTQDQDRRAAMTEFLKACTELAKLGTEALKQALAEHAKEASETTRRAPAMSTTIEWTDETWNPVTGCDRISPGCAHCYAKALHDMRHQAFLNGKKMPAQYSVPFETVKCWPERLEIPLRWRKPRRCFVNSMSDLFHEDVDFPFLALVYAHMALAEQHTFQFLTKRPDRMLRWYGEAPKHPMFFELGTGKRFTLATNLAGGSVPFICKKVNTMLWPLPNVWPGVSVESRRYLPRLDALRQVPAAVRMVSFEPLLEDLGTVNLQGIGWAIAGGESGPGARPVHPDWVRSLRDQCIAQGVPFFFKQWGEWAPHSEPPDRHGDYHGGVFLLPSGRLGNQGDWWDGRAQAIDRVGKKHAGAALDGREWREFPEARAA
jgi:protein gp37